MQAEPGRPCIGATQTPPLLPPLTMTLRLSRPPPGSVMYRLIHSTSRCARSISEYTCSIILNRGRWVTQRSDTLL